MERMLGKFGAAPPPNGEPAPRIEDTPVLIVIGTLPHFYLSTLAGGDAAEREWRQRYGHALVFHVRADHSTVVRTRDTALIVLRELATHCARSLPHAALARSLEEFDSVAGALDSAQSFLKSTWCRHRGADTDVPLPPTGGQHGEGRDVMRDPPTQAVQTDRGAGSRMPSQRLVEGGFRAAAEALGVHGYDDAFLWARMDEDEKKDAFRVMELSDSEASAVLAAMAASSSRAPP